MPKFTDGIGSEIFSKEHFIDKRFETEKKIERRIGEVRLWVKWNIKTGDILNQ